MYCSECGTKNDDDALFCSNCGNKLSRPSTQEKTGLSVSSALEPSYSQETYTGRPPSYQSPQSSGYYDQQRYGKKDEVNPLYYVCSFCIPLVGLIGFFLIRNEKPQSAKNMLIAAAIGFVISIILNFGRFGYGY